MKLFYKHSILLLCGLFIFSLQVEAQKNKTPIPSYSPDSIYALKEKVYRQSLKYNDLGVATQTLYEMMALAPEKKALKDTLAMLYFERGLYVNSLIVGDEVLKDKPDNLGMMEIVAVSKETLGFVKDALEDYEDLYKKSQMVEHLYEIIKLQYTLKRYGECQATANAAFQHPKASEATVSINMQDGRRQTVPVKAAIYNILGVVYIDMKEIDNASKAFESALAILPEFELAKNNLALIRKQEGN